MAEKISESKGFDGPAFDTYVPELEEAADIRNALELFFYGNSEDGNATGDVSLYATLVDLDTRISQNDSSFDGHTGAISDVHGVGAGNLVVGTGTSQTLTNKILTSPVVTSPTISGGTLNGGASLTVDSTELNYVDGVTSSIQTQINTNTPTGMVAIHAGSSAPTGWLLCDGTTYENSLFPALSAVLGTTYGGVPGSLFSVPNLKGKVVVGIDVTQPQFDTRGETGGSMSHQHASSVSGNTSIGHNHSIDPPVTNSSNHDGHNHNITGHTHDTTDHSHSVNPGETATSGDNHSHSTNANAAYLKVSSGSSSLNVASGQHNHGINSDNHSHNVNIATLTSGGANAGNTTGGASANVTSGNYGGHAHSLDIAAFNTTGSEGGSHTHTTPLSDIISNLQPYIALNYIIKT